MRKLFMYSLILIILLLLGYIIIMSSPQLLEIVRPSPKEQSCPDEWYINNLPETVEYKNISREYFLVDGYRRELNEFDLDWVNENCEVQKREVTLENI